MDMAQGQPDFGDFQILVYYLLLYFTSLGILLISHYPRFVQFTKDNYLRSILILGVLIGLRMEVKVLLSPVIGKIKIDGFD